jgi:hypothetical protein
MPRPGQSQELLTRCQLTSLGIHSVEIRDISRSILSDAHFGHGGAGFVEADWNSSNCSPHDSQRYS